MEMLWFGIVALVLTIYVVMDGFDFGAGILHLWVARTDMERRQVLGAIGPLWDGNEVWLVAAGGVLFAAFPGVLAVGFSGFYLAIWMIVWSLMLRGIAIEFRSHVRDALWRQFWDVAFAAASVLLPVLLGAALGNVIRGVPVGESGFFELPLWTDFRPGVNPGILDWYTLLAGLFALVTVAAHGAVFLAWKTEGPVHDRARWLAVRLWVLVIALWLVTTAATPVANRSLLASLPDRPVAWAGMLLFLSGLAAVILGLRRGRFLQAFLGSGAFIFGLLAATAACLYPVMLRSSIDPGFDLTALNQSAGSYGLKAGFAWWICAFPLVVGYFVLLFRIHRGKIAAAADGEGY